MPTIQGFSTRKAEKLIEATKGVFRKPTPAELAKPSVPTEKPIAEGEKPEVG